MALSHFLIVDRPFVLCLRHRINKESHWKIKHKARKWNMYRYSTVLNYMCLMIIRIYVYCTQLQSCSWDEWFSQNKNSCGEIFSNCNSNNKSRKIKRCTLKYYSSWQSICNYLFIPDTAQLKCNYKYNICSIFCACSENNTKYSNISLSF